VARHLLKQWRPVSWSSWSKQEESLFFHNRLRYDLVCCVLSRQAMPLLRKLFIHRCHNPLLYQIRNEQIYSLNIQRWVGGGGANAALQLNIMLCTNTGKNISRFCHKVHTWTHKKTNSLYNSTHKWRHLYTHLYTHHSTLSSETNKYYNSSSVSTAMTKPTQRVFLHRIHRILLWGCNTDLPIIVGEERQITLYVVVSESWIHRNSSSTPQPVVTSCRHTGNMWTNTKLSHTITLN